MKKIIWISSYPKSGNTWTRYFLSNYFFNKQKINSDFNILNKIDKFPPYKILQQLLSEDEINQMVKDAETNKEADKKKREAVDARNQADTLLHSTEKNLKEHGSKVSDADKKAIEDASANVRNALKGTDVEEIKKKTQDLVQASMKLGEAIYKSQQSTKPGDAPKDAKEEGKKDDNVVDADFEEVKDDKEKSA